MIRIPPGSQQIAVTNGSFTQPAVDATVTVSWDSTKWRPGIGAVLSCSAGVYELSAANTLKLLIMKSVAETDEVPEGTAMFLAYYKGRKNPNSPPSSPPV